MTAANPSTVKLTKADRAAISAFIDHKPHRGGVKLESTGERLDGTWMGGQGIAYWKGDKIHFSDTGSRAGQSIQRILRKETPKFWLSAAAQRGVATNGAGTTLLAAGAGAAVGYFARGKMQGKKDPAGHSGVHVTEIQDSDYGPAKIIIDDKRNRMFFETSKGRKEVEIYKDRDVWWVDELSPDGYTTQHIVKLRSAPAGWVKERHQHHQIKAKKSNPMGPSTSAALKRSLMR